MKNSILHQVFLWLLCASFMIIAFIMFKKQFLLGFLFFSIVAIMCAVLSLMVKYSSESIREYHEKMKKLEVLKENTIKRDRINKNRSNFKLIQGDKK